MKLLALVPFAVLSSAGALDLPAAVGLEVLRSELSASVTTLAGGNLKDSRVHVDHALDRVWPQLSPRIAASQRQAFAAGLQTLRRGPGSLTPTAYEQVVNRFVGGPWEAAWTAARQGAGSDFEGALTGALLSSAQKAYGTAPTVGREGRAVDTQDAVALLGRALPHATQVSPQAAQGVSALQGLARQGAPAQAFNQRAAQVLGTLQVPGSPQAPRGGAEALRLLDLSLQAARDEYVGEGEVDEGLGSLTDADQQWAALRAAVEGRNAPLAASFSAALAKLRTALDANDTAAFSAAHTDAMALLTQIRAALK
ncbi:hypothetical protein [Deinococcus koreensis]|uniref:Imelysin-like domain-containing protein n=1 Tax=Deinococcus koreensis TaxID=2054903 RepID=A0A2K3USG2_9DEIO|nr:hypothetical protein [Deinococcus koreensis]PNY79447.1 hypothetical protein CVO96_18590 [Deinococcus koreensis]